MQPLSLQSPAGISRRWDLPRPVMLLSLLALLPGAARAEITKEQSQFFEKTIRPILAENCFKCHSAAEGKTKGGLALDTKQGLIKGGDEGGTLVPGDPGKSALIKRIITKDAEEKMPPKDATLTAAEINALTQWVQMGAPYSENKAIAGGTPYGGAKAKAHWAWQPLKPQQPPVVKNAPWAKTAVDSFILAKLEAQGMAPNPMADRATLIRRAYFDLTGLPPMPWEVQAFIDDKAPNAWEKVIDRLLASPHYGERWGRHWLDVARYSDTKGDVKKRDETRYVDAWTYRDWVIGAFNRDLPYDQFIMQQLAADAIVRPDAPDKTPLAALGFLTVGDRFGGAKNDIINDRIDVVSKGFLGLTASCARCHDHMFDPIPQADYYSLHGIFASCAEPKDNPIIAARGNAQQYQDYLKAKAEASLGAARLIEAEFSAVQKMFRDHTSDFLMAATLSGGERTPYLKRIGGNGKQVEDMLQVLRRGNKVFRSSPIFGPWVRFAELDKKNFAQKASEICGSIQELAAKGRVNLAVAAAFKGKSPASIEDVANIYGDIFKQYDAYQKSKATSGKNATASQMTPATAMAMVSATKSMEREKGAKRKMKENKKNDAPTPTSQTMAGALEELRYAPWTEDPVEDFEPQRDLKLLGNKVQGQYARLSTAIDKVDLTHPGAPHRAMTLEDSARPQDSPILIRGEAGSKGEVVPRRFLEILSPAKRVAFTKGSGRLELAQSIANPANPLTSRVMVNRIWLHHFGEGFVTTPDDFGTMSAPPSHPELLDYLSSSFVQSGWSIKRMHKLIMLSSVYQQSSNTRPELAAKDPNNRLLWRQNLRRLDFESLRDGLLHIGGKLDLTIGGQPENILSEPYSLRRSVYGYVDRANLPEMMTHFDFANPAMPTGRRHETTVPQQALFMMNSPLMVDVARRLLARKEMSQATNDAQRIHALYWMIMQRPPKPAEITLGQAFLAANPVDEDLPKSAAADTADSTAMSKAEKVKKKKKDKEDIAKRRNEFDLINKGERVERKELSAWEKYTQALLMTNEMVHYN